jgi:2-polyprenyl-6-methoxyphenol hydroxylase-like FAD-dependent oxidoreductase
MTNPLNIAIAGCGIGGLAAATLLAKQGQTITVFDQFAKPEPVGSGLVIQPVGQMVLQATGTLDAALILGNPIQRLTGRTAPYDRLVLDVSYGHGRFGLAIHRAALFSVMLDAAIAAGVTITPNARVSSSGLLAQGRVLDFATIPRQGPFDLVIDATGARSPLSPIINHRLPFGALWATVDWPESSSLPKDHLSQKYQGSNIMAGVLPIGTMPGDITQKAAIFWSLKHEDYENWSTSPLAQWRKQSVDHWPQFAPFVRQIARHEDFTMARYSHGTLRNPVDTRLVHIGDAAHTASPQLGQGANMALLDAYALALSLGHQDLPQALETYRQSRRNHTRTYQTFSRLFTPFYQSEGKALPMLRDYILAPPTFIPPMNRILQRLVSGDLVPPIQGGLAPRK